MGFAQRHIPVFNQCATKMELTDYIKVYMIFCYIFGLSPFYFSEEGSNKVSNPIKIFSTINRQKFCIKSWLPQKLFCFIHTFLGCFWFLREMRQSRPVNSNIPTLHFRSMVSILTSLIKGTMIKNFWFNQESILNILNFISSQRTHNPLEERMRSKHKMSKFLSPKYITILFCLLCLALTHFNMSIGRGLYGYYDADKSDANWIKPIWRWEKMEVAARYNFFVENLNVSNNILSGWVLTAPASIGYHFRQSIGYFCDTFLLMNVLTMWTAAKSFAVLLEKDASDGTVPQWKGIYDRFKFLEDLSVYINKVVGTQTTLFLVEMVLYYAVNLDDVFIDGRRDFDWGKVIPLIMKIALGFSVVLFSADS